MKATSNRIAQWTSGSALGFLVVCALVRPEGLVGAAAGSAVAIVSALLLSRLTVAMLSAGENAKALFALLLIGKSVLVLGGTAAFLFIGRVDVVGFALGVSALVVGVLGGVAHGFINESPDGKTPPADGTPDATPGATNVKGAA